uniref:Major intrinsic family protein n=1 Tax=Zygnema circumcarinatum TaxID=35869 RepID=A0A6M3T0L3_ZYGCR|nr:major intrinsic family protein [Zygnema circumcarinatum]
MAAAAQDAFREAVFGREGGARQRVFRKAKASALATGTRALPRTVDGGYAHGVARAAAAEFLALLVFVFVSAGSVESFSKITGGSTDSGYVLGVAFAHGITIALTVAIAAAYSGGHVNPAVTLGFLLTGRLDVLAAIAYWVAQLLGAIAGGFLLSLIWGKKVHGLGSHSFAPGVSTVHGLEVEIILTFVLVLTVWGTAVDPRGNKTLAPYLIGLAVFVGVLFGAPLTGPSLNPARTVGVAVWSGNWDHHWVYWLGPFIGAAVAALLFELAFIRATDPPEHDDIYEEILANEEFQA